MVIVYKSNTGFTKEYAEMLANAEKMKHYELSQAQKELGRETEVLFMGPLMAGHIQGIDQAVKSFNVKAACGVGMTPPGSPSLSSLSKANYVPNAPIFYLQGGWAPKQVGWFQRRAVGMVTRGIRKQLLSKSKRTEQEQAYLDMLLRGGSFVEYQSLKPIQEWLEANG